MKDFTIDKPKVYFTKYGAPYVHLKDILRSKAGQVQINLLRKLMVKEACRNSEIVKSLKKKTNVYN